MLKLTAMQHPVRWRSASVCIKSLNWLHNRLFLFITGRRSCITGELSENRVTFLLPCTMCVCLQTNSHWWLPGSSSTCSSDAECAPKRGDAGFPWWHRDLPDSDVSAKNISNGSRRACACVCGSDGMEDTVNGFGRRNFMRLMFPEQTLSH